MQLRTTSCFNVRRFVTNTVTTTFVSALSLQELTTVTHYSLNQILTQKHLTLEQSFFIFIFYFLFIFYLKICELPVAVAGSPNLLCCILRYFSDFAFCCCVI